MLTSAAKRFSLPFSNQKTSTSEVEAAAVFAVAELERGKGGGLITRQPEEKLVFLSKIGYPLWLFPRSDVGFVFDGFGDSSYNVSFLDVQSAKAFKESLEANSAPKENYLTFLSDHGSYFQQPMKEKQLVFRGLIADSDFKGEFNVYRKEAAEITAPPNIALLAPALEESAVLAMLSEFEKLQSGLREEAERLTECIRFVNKTTSQYITEIDYKASATKEEADAKIRAQEELVNPKIKQLTKDYERKIKNATESFDKELESLRKQKTKTLKSIASNEEKIKLYEREAKAQAEKKHVVYEKRWKEKIKRIRKDLGGLKKELKNIDNNFKKLSKQKTLEISKLNFGLDAEIKFAREPLLQLEAARDAKIRVFKLETEKLLKFEKPVLEGLSKSTKLRETIKVRFDGLGIKDSSLKNSALFYVPFYAVCYEAGLARRYVFIPPSAVGSADFSAKIKGAFGMSKIKDHLTPRFKTVATLISKVQELTRQNGMFESQLNSLAEKNNLLTNSLFMENVRKGLVYLKSEDWVSEKEYQLLSSHLTFQR
jgi:hypothetical protein